MANQRSKDKVHLGGYFSKTLKNNLSTIAKQRGVTMTELTEQILQDAVDRQTPAVQFPIDVSFSNDAASETAIVGEVSYRARKKKK